MNAKGLVIVSALTSVIIGAPRSATAQTELKNDGFAVSSAASFQGGFVAGEMAAARLVAPSAGMQVTKIRLLFGGGAATHTFRLHIWNDEALTTAPGTELHGADYSLVGMDSALQEIDISSAKVILPKTTFRVGIEFQKDGVPSVAVDTDGSTQSNRNFLNDSTAGWRTTQDVGLMGDWIIRADVVIPGSSTDAGQDTMSVASDAATSGPDTMSVPSGDAGGTTSCQVNGDCALGNYCHPTAKMCTFDCRTSADCSGSTTCNSLGMCVAKSDGGGGCGCRVGAGTGTGEGALCFVLAGGAALWARRRRVANRTA